MIAGGVTREISFSGKGPHEQRAPRHSRGRAAARVQPVVRVSDHIHHPRGLAPRASVAHRQDIARVLDRRTEEGTMPKLAKRPDSPNYYAWITDPATGKKKRQSTRERNQRTAGAVAERRERGNFSSYNPTTLEEAIDTFLNQVAVKKAKATLEFYVKKCEVLSTLLGSRRDMATIDAPVVD